jgi:endonuclease YncB( thermonuclease family)
MFFPIATSGFRAARGVAAVLGAILPAIASAGPVQAAGCSLPSQGEAHVTGVIDGRGVQLADGREIKLAGIEAIPAATKTDRTAALSAIIADRDVVLRGEDDMPDRYGRQTAFVFLAGSETPVQNLLLAQGEALASPDIADKDCAASLMAAEEEARQARRGFWASPAAIKNAESPDDILAGIGLFTVVEGKVLSVRQAGATTYLNFGRNWTRGFAATISRRMLPTLAAAGIAPKSLENRRIRLRGWIEARSGPRSGPRMEVLRAGQIEMLDAN